MDLCCAAPCNAARFSAGAGTFCLYACTAAADAQRPSAAAGPALAPPHPHARAAAAAGAGRVCEPHEPQLHPQLPGHHHGLRRAPDHRALHAAPRARGWVGGRGGRGGWRTAAWMPPHLRSPLASSPPPSPCQPRHPPSHPPTHPPTQSGEELTFDYSSVTESEKEFREALCLCSTRNCRRARGRCWGTVAVTASSGAGVLGCQRPQGHVPGLPVLAPLTHQPGCPPCCLCLCAHPPTARARPAGAPTCTSPAAAPSSRSWRPSTPSCTARSSSRARGRSRWGSRTGPASRWARGGRRAVAAAGVARSLSRR